MKLRTKVVLALAVLGILSSHQATQAALSEGRHVAALAKQELTKELNGLQHPSPSTARHATQAASPAGSRSSFKYTATNSDGTPARWSCGIHPIVINPHGAPAGAIADFKTALARMNAATGLHFVITGTTTQTPTSNWGEDRTALNPSGWAPILIAWGTPGTGALGVGGESADTQPIWIENDQGKNVFVSASIVFSTQDAGYSPGFQPGTLSRGALYQHELGHLAGLADLSAPTDRSQLMYGYIGATTTYGAGDLTGLRNLGHGPCLSVPAPSWG